MLVLSSVHNLKLTGDISNLFLFDDFALIHFTDRSFKVAFTPTLVTSFYANWAKPLSGGRSDNVL